MRRLFVPVVALVSAAMLVVAGCSSAAPAPAPTQAPAKAAEPTKAAAPAGAAPTTAATPAAAQTAWPEKGKVITQNVPYGAGGGGDITARAMQPLLEKELGVSMPIVNLAGGGGQVGMTEFVKSAKPDGYMLVWTIIPNVQSSYLDPERKAVYSMKDLQLVANFAYDPVVIAVKKGSQFKTLADLITYAKANPKKVRASSSGLMATSHVGGTMLQMQAGFEFAHMFFEQQGEQRAALLGDHLEVELNTTSEVVAGIKGGELDALAILDDQPNKFLPGVKTAKEQGYNVSMASSRGIALKSGTPMEIVTKMADAVKKIEADPANKAQFDKMNLGTKYLGPKEYTDYWAEAEKAIKAVLDETKKK